MLNKQGFNLWADNYDNTVQISEENNDYPFAGYKQILNVIFNEVMQKTCSDVLDIGFGTGVLTSKLYENRHQIDGLDFSPKMISIAKAKMPGANLIEWDISKGLPSKIIDNRYDSIVSTYTLHHLTEGEKVSFVTKLLSLLKAEGQILIGDIAFQSREKLNICRENNLHHWDDDEFYFVFDELKSALASICNCKFYSISHCGGVIIISK
ncbi:putative AdoMet-dependent methyltransferase [Cytobacillus eiseniae]|uniref:AdoMet-dependent methyltransferase n=1 Tax=Cytobacillus eiseniae TaxID=762947 RepID=A0ABS4RLD6_9BACI|nr:putative AdoMet-dependent methyltransferase [Cytobacillus eiseniae]